MLIYFIARPKQADWFEPNDPYAMSNAPAPDGIPSPAQQLESLSRMHDNGQLTDEEFARMKAGVLNPSPSPNPS